MAGFNDVLNFVFDVTGLKETNPDRKALQPNLSDFQIAKVSDQTVTLLVPDTSSQGQLNRRNSIRNLGTTDVPLDARTVQTEINLAEKLKFDSEGNTVFDFTGVGGGEFYGTIEQLQAISGPELLHVIGRSVPQSATNYTFNSTFEPVSGELITPVLDTQAKQNDIPAGIQGALERSRVSPNLSSEDANQSSTNVNSSPRIINQEQEKQRTSRDSKSSTTVDENGTDDNIISLSSLDTKALNVSLESIQNAKEGTTFSRESLLANFGINTLGGNK